MEFPLFPLNKRAEENSLHQQLNKVLEEATEALNAYLDKEDDVRIIEELLDTIHACEGALAKFDREQIGLMRVYVLVKNAARGDYL